MANAALSGFLSGAVKGYDTAQEEQRIKAREDRENQRFGWEKAEAERKLNMQKKEEEARAEYESALDNFNNQTGEYAKYASPEVKAAQQEAGQKSALSYSNAEEARLSNYGGTGTERLNAERPTATPTDQAQAFLKAPMQYQNVKAAEDTLYKQLGNALKKSYLARGELGKAAMVDTEMNELREKQYEPARRNAAAAAMMGASPEALQPLLDKTYGAWKDGKDVKVNSVQIDPKTQMPMYGISFVDKETGKSIDRQFSGMQIYGLLQSENAFNAAKFNIETRIKQQLADADTTKANAYATMAVDNAATNKTTRAANVAIQERQQSMKEDESAQRTFGSAFGVKDFTVKTKEEVEALMPKQREEYAQARKEHERRLSSANDAYNIFQINQRRIPASEIVAALPKLQARLASGQGADGIDEKTGLPYVNYNGQKMLLPKE